MLKSADRESESPCISSEDPTASKDEAPADNAQPKSDEVVKAVAPILLRAGEVQGLCGNAHLLPYSELRHFDAMVEKRKPQNGPFIVLLAAGWLVDVTTWDRMKDGEFEPEVFLRAT